MSQPQNIGTNKQYHWWYDSKSAGVRNAPGGNLSASPPTSPMDPNSPRRFSITKILGASPPNTTATDIGGRPRRDSLKQIYLLSDFGTPGT
jgi:hypothetical protein